MAAKKNDKSLLKKLKKQVRVLGKKEERSRNQLKAAIKKMRTIAKQTRSKLMGKARFVKAKLAEIKGSTYAKVAVDLERQLLSGVEGKAKALAAALTRMEKKRIAKLAKGIAKKGRKVKKSKPVKVKKAKRSKHKTHKRSHKRR